jgi:hypothetical protein
MPRELSPELEALINSGHCRQYSTVDLTLTGGTPLYVSTGEIVVERDGEPVQYAAQISEASPFEMELNEREDQVTFNFQNVDQVMGRALTGSERRLDGARGMLGIAFQDTETGATFYDPKMPGEIATGIIDQNAASFTLLSDVDATVISGRTLSTVFPWREPLSTAPDSDPDDLAGDFIIRRRPDPNDLSGGGNQFRYLNPFVS